MCRLCARLLLLRGRAGSARPLNLFFLPQNVAPTGPLFHDPSSCKDKKTGTPRRRGNATRKKDTQPDGRCASGVVGNEKIQEAHYKSRQVTTTNPASSEPPNQSRQSTRVHAFYPPRRLFSVSFVCEVDRSNGKPLACGVMSSLSDYVPRWIYEDRSAWVAHRGGPRSNKRQRGKPP
ncbi:hypothetical protein pneo_cds_213 [Pandoravirus neocaledonia]|uniref:Uncharacterized protein n=1 Tax=Pandoravirus neocaledonia TaxID=2107708 RepID=A0A2U7UBW8_9VIRU|nr:hypothetical protein pneo_cds_213 [Pandoravirus neocaledonia]AVK75820.1 hypothetical protein pneo_cds_213 [Pandoravirus neocaledonia]